ncbi:histidine phosphatase family protein [Nocardioides sp.]|uniref:histidine phosphatase family protein n=1 Tax=Nocardioides sp. TaxID=35761 RepID=UPI0025D9B6EA|nr:histidine phosphatase family protein [Nocardioides sp.]
MSSLQCPARIFLARHGEAEYETTLVTDDGGSLTGRGREQSRALADRLRGERIARVWSSPLSRAVQTAEIAAAALGVDVVVREGLREYGVGSLAGTDADEAATIDPVFRAWTEGDDSATIPGGESIAGIVDRVRAVLQEIADAHPGEAVLVVAHGGTIQMSLPELVGRPRSAAYGFVLPGGGAITLEADADGWRLVPWDLDHDEVRLP